ncbi:hypothetical protein ABW19_dt0205024 [Dactylella cylindrospora]|nr:hypothetical protein ABW19_dt0205024 [Dactylella cylindrospora]
MYHRTSRAPPETPSGTLPIENQLFQHPPSHSSASSSSAGVGGAGGGSSSVASSGSNNNNNPNSIDQYSSNASVHISDPGSPIALQFQPRRASSYRPPSPSKRPYHKRNYSSVESDDGSWFSRSNIPMFLLIAVIVGLLFFQSPVGSQGIQFLNSFDGDPWGESCPDYKDYSGRRHLPVSDGPLKLPFQRPVPECRSFVSREVERVIKEITGKLMDKDLARLFENCYPSTLDTTVRWHVETSPSLSEFDDEALKGPQSFIVTGDINAEWLRDSTNQLAGYMPLLKKDERLRKLVLGAINTQAGYVIESPYCNAFQPPRGSHVKPSNNGQDDNVHPAYDHTVVFECKYEIDSLANFFSLANQYYENTGDFSFVNTRFMSAVESVFNVLDEQAMGTFNDAGIAQFPGYTFQRNTNIGTETLALSGRGNPLNNGSSLIRSAFRPSDDACILQYFIPGNAFMSVELRRLSTLLTKAGRSEASVAKKWADSIAEGVKKHGIVEHAVFGKVYAFEVDGYGSRIIMDDANLPSLLSLPHMGWTDVNDPVYQNTRKMILSQQGNPYFLKGHVFKGIGGPHIGLKHAWPMSLLMQAMTSNDDAEIMDAIEMVKKASKFGLINESVNVQRNGDYTRSWFAWANSVFAQAILDLAKRKPHLIFGAGAKPYEI